MATRLGLSPNEVEEMYLDRAESLINYWSEEAGMGPPSGSAGGPMTPSQIAASFGGRVVRGGRRG